MTNQNMTDKFTGGTWDVKYLHVLLYFSFFTLFSINYIRTSFYSQQQIYTVLELLLGWIFFFVKVEPSPSKKILCYLHDWKPFRSCEKCFYFHFKSSFRSQDNKVLSRLFDHVRKTVWLERLTSIFMTSQPGLQKYCQISHKVKATWKWNLVN